MKIPITSKLTSFIGATLLACSAQTMAAEVAQPTDKSLPTIAKTIENASGGLAPNFTCLHYLLTTTRAGATLNGERPYTLYAPTDKAFSALLTEANSGKNTNFCDKNSFAKFDPAHLSNLVRYHIMQGDRKLSSLRKDTGAVMSNGDFAEVFFEGLNMRIDQSEHARVVFGNIPASNGRIHVIDTVIQPASL